MSHFFFTLSFPLLKQKSLERKIYNDEKEIFLKAAEKSFILMVKAHSDSQHVECGPLK